MMTGDGFIELAGRLAAGARTDEPTCRTAISRAYYGSFHLVLALLASLGLKVNRDHGELQRSMSESGHRRAVEVGRLLTELHRFRTKADYDLANLQVGNPRFAHDCVELAIDLRLIVQEISTPSHRKEIKSGIEAYRRKIGR